MTVLVVNCNIRMGSISGAACPVIYTTNNVYVIWEAFMTAVCSDIFQASQLLIRRSHVMFPGEVAPLQCLLQNFMLTWLITKQ